MRDQPSRRDVQRFPVPHIPEKVVHRIGIEVSRSRRVEREMIDLLDPLNAPLAVGKRRLAGVFPSCGLDATLARIIGHAGDISPRP